MMTILSKLVGFLGGPALAPLAILGCLWLGGNMLKERRAELRSEGKQACIAEWEKTNLIQQRDAARADARAAASQQAAVDVLNMELKANAANLENELEQYRLAAAGADERCLSDRVRELARGVPAGPGNGGGQAGGQPAGNSKSVRPKAP